MNARELYEKQDLNCAESIIKSMNEKYSFGLSEEDLTLLAGFGAGMGCGEACGALCGCIATLGRLAVKQRAHATEGFGKLCADFVELFNQNLGGVNCRDVKPKNYQSQIRCALTVEKAQKLLESYISEHNLKVR